MATTEPKPEDVEAVLNGLLAQLSNAHLLGLRCLANHERTRAARLARLEARLKPGLGANHPDVLALHAAAARMTERARVLSVAADRKARQPKAGRDDWNVYGCVLDKEHSPVSGVRVRLLGKDPARDLPAAHTDEHGDFFIVLHKDDLATLLDDKADLHLRVETDKGRVLYASEQSIHCIAGHAEYFEIVLEGRGTTARNSNRDALSAEVSKAPASEAPIPSSADQPAGTARSAGTPPAARGSATRRATPKPKASRAASRTATAPVSRRAGRKKS
jgi:hypothetical protein